MISANLPDIPLILFWIFATVLVLAGIRVITARNPVHAALSLVLCFFQASLLWMLLKAEFLSITLVLVYVGAVMVLFLFVVMMLDINFDSLRDGFKQYLLIGTAVAALMVFEIAAVIIQAFSGSTSANLPAASASVGNTKVLGVAMYTHYTIAVEIASVILLVAIIAAMALTLRRRIDVKYNDPAAAIRTKAKDRLRMVKIDAVKTTPNAAQTDGVSA